MPPPFLLPYKVLGIPVSNQVTSVVLELANKEHDKVNQGPNPKTTHSENHGDAGTDLAYIEAVHPDGSEEGTEQGSD
jgi:hypothetical protein